ncbi:MAG TPA: nucleoside triphosphate pyrophosphatase [Planctomycetota bacterium]|nr:hypothetical protein [Planctomycetota bacterium]MDP6129061.1 nucleoside triphosphate pyrophosphatase [Planctomycetota bacterium]MDP7246365.1 nucleoside triphosphate pyrophosphatase [Planctomycetota bacterium]MDP7560334.1 nucleoside triphosphate pyrophosphatase [Planctomycetota bacterium]HJM39131.1 nucleoside triphosphate pyrophosphatase [Planctomycetota bacterium]
MDALGLPLVLASTSPRRVQALNELGISFRQVNPGPDGPSVSADPKERVLGHARYKVAAVQSQAMEPVFILGGDTLVWREGRFYPKPSDRVDAREMLLSLMGKEHQVWTSHVLQISNGPSLERVDCSTVSFRAIPPEELEKYLLGEEWVDKAGGYGIQGWAGNWARILEGDMGTVIGFRKDSVLSLLEEAKACLRENRR